MRSLPVGVLALGLLAILTPAVLACGGDKEPAAPPLAPAAAPTEAAQSKLTAIPTRLPPFVIGVMESVTGPGETYGEADGRGRSQRAQAGLVVEDSQCSAKDAIAAYSKLTDADGVKIMFGTSCSGAMLGAAPLAEADGVILFSGLASNPDIASAGDYIFRTQISDVQVGMVVVHVLFAGVALGQIHRVVVEGSSGEARGPLWGRAQSVPRIASRAVAVQRVSLDLVARAGIMLLSRRFDNRSGCLPGWLTLGMSNFKLPPRSPIFLSPTSTRRPIPGEAFA